MAFGLSAPGKSPEHHAHEAAFRTLADYRQLIRDVANQGLVDIMLMSASTSEVLTISERFFDHSHVTPAIRANDTSDIWLAGKEAQYGSQPARTFRSASLDHAMCGKTECTTEERNRGANLGLYSLTFNNDVDLDRETLENYKAFRAEAEVKGFRHFLELFDPNAPVKPISNVGSFINDHIARTLAGVTMSQRPVFLKIPYHGPEAMEALAAYDPNLIPGILGGSAGTAFDAFHQLAEAKKYGAKVALYGRKINHSEHQLTFVSYLRAVADGLVTAKEAVKAYHGDLGQLGIKPYRTLEEDLVESSTASSYAGGGGGAKLKSTKTAVAIDGCQKGGNEDVVDFSKMTSSEKIAWNKKRWDDVLG